MAEAGTGPGLQRKPTGPKGSGGDNANAQQAAKTYLARKMANQAG